MNQQRLSLTLVILLLLFGAGAAVAQEGGPAPESVASPEVVLGAGFTYQGQLKQNGSAVNGTCDLEFGVWDSVSGGVQLGVTQTVSSVAVTNGLFTATLNGGNEFGSSAFQGDARYLQATVRCPDGSGSYTALDPRQALTAAPYALSLMPGATISATTTGNVLHVNNLSTGGGRAAYFTNYSDDFSAVVRADSFGNGYGVLATSDAGTGVYGASGSSIGVHGASGSGIGVYGGSGSSIGVYAYSSAGTAIYADGDVSQTLADDGLVKAGVYAVCSDTISSITRSFNNVNATAITISNGGAVGECVIDFGFDVSSRYIVATATVSSAARGVTILTFTGETATFFRWDDTGSGINGYIFVLVY